MADVGASASFKLSFETVNLAESRYDISRVLDNYVLETSAGPEEGSI